MNNLFTGRIARLNYFLAGVGLLVIALIFNFIITYLSLIGLLLMFIAYIVYIFFGFSLAIRRLHDLNWNGWLSLISFIPVVNFIFALIVLFKRGTEGNNKYGPEPKTDIDILGTIWPSKLNNTTPTQTQAEPQAQTQTEDQAQTGAGTQTEAQTTPSSQPPQV